MGDFYIGNGGSELGESEAWKMFNAEGDGSLNGLAIGGEGAAKNMLDLVKNPEYGRAVVSPAEGVAVLSTGKGVRESLTFDSSAEEAVEGEESGESSFYAGETVTEPLNIINAGESELVEAYSEGASKSQGGVSGEELRVKLD